MSRVLAFCKRVLADSTWQGIGAIAGIVAIIVSIYVAQPSAPDDGSTGGEAEASTVAITAKTTATAADRSVMAQTSTTAAQSPTTSSTKRPQWELIIEPPVARGYVEWEHLVYVTLRDLNGFVVVGETVHLAIVAGPHTGLTLAIKTNEAGQGAFSYVGKKEGTDLIRVWAGAQSYEDALRGSKAEVTKNWF